MKKTQSHASRATTLIFDKDIKDISVGFESLKTLNVGKTLIVDTTLRKNKEQSQSRFHKKPNNKDSMFSNVPRKDAERLNREHEAKLKTSRVDMTADALVARLNDPNSRRFFCKCAWHLSDDEIWSIFESATKPGIKAPSRYFIVACNKAMQQKQKKQAKKQVRKAWQARR